MEYGFLPLSTVNDIRQDKEGLAYLLVCPGPRKHSCLPARLLLYHLLGELKGGLDSHHRSGTIRSSSRSFGEHEHAQVKDSLGFLALT